MLTITRLPVDSNITATSDGTAIDITEHTSRTYVTDLDPSWLAHSHRTRHHDSESDSDESNEITIEFERDTSSPASEANDEDSDHDSIDGTSTETSPGDKSSEV